MCWNKTFILGECEISNMSQESDLNYFYWIWKFNRYILVTQLVFWDCTFWVKLQLKSVSTPGVSASRSMCSCVMQKPTFRLWTRFRTFTWGLPLMTPPMTGVLFRHRRIMHFATDNCDRHTVHGAVIKQLSFTHFGQFHPEGSYINLAISWPQNAMTCNRPKNSRVKGLSTQTILQRQRTSIRNYDIKWKGPNLQQSPV